MANYGVSRNIEASLIDYLNEKLEEYNWRNVNVIKGFKRAYDLDLPVIAVMVDETTHKRVGIGGNETYREVLLHIYIFAKSDGQRLDLKDFVVDIVKGSLPYYEYTIEHGKVVSKNYVCQMFVNDIIDRKAYAIDDISNLDVHDRYRHYIGLYLSIPKVEGVR